MNIKERPSPHFSRRHSPTITAIIFHATANKSAEVTLDWFEDINSKVSSHYVIDKNGDVYRPVPDMFKAWHAGDSELWGVENVNEFSLGIELVNMNDGVDEYPPEQIQSSIELCTELCHTYGIWLNRVVGHEHIAQGRKTDPGKQFPWKEFLISLGGHLA